MAIPVNNDGRQPVAPAWLLRAVEPGDAEALCRLANLPAVRCGTLRIPFDTPGFWRERIAACGPEATWIVAEVAGAVVGHGNLFAGTKPRVAHVGQILAMVVHDDFAGRGIGTAILAALLDVADNWRGLKRLELDVFADNQPAIRLYERHGFAVEGRRIKAALTDGAYVDMLSMARLRF